MAEEKKEQTSNIDQEKQAKIKKQADQDEQETALKQTSPEKLRTMLSNKNSDYVFHLQKELENQGKLSASDAVAKVNEFLPEIIIAQRHGQPANGLYMASPKIRAGQILHPDVKPETLADKPLWQRMVDNVLFWIAIFMAMYGVLGLFSANSKQANTGQNGILTILIVSSLLGVVMTKYNDWLMPQAGKKRKVNWVRVILITIGIVVGILIVVGLTTLPALRIINPILPGIAYLIIAAVVYGGRFLFRRQYHITGSAFGPDPRQVKR